MLVRVYLLVYLTLVVGAAWVLHSSGILARIPRLWIVIAAVVIVGLGAVVALTSSSSHSTKPS
jgi:hypothetical protein